MFIMAGDIRRSHLLLTAERRGKRPQQRINRPQRKNDRQRERGGGGCNGNTGEGVVGWGREMMQKMRGNEKSEEMEMQMVNKKNMP